MVRVAGGELFAGETGDNIIGSKAASMPPDRRRNNKAQHAPIQRCVNPGMINPGIAKLQFPAACQSLGLESLGQIWDPKIRKFGIPKFAPRCLLVGAYWPLWRKKGRGWFPLPYDSCHRAGAAQMLAAKQPRQLQDAGVQSSLLGCTV